MSNVAIPKVKGGLYVSSLMHALIELSLMIYLPWLWWVKTNGFHFQVRNFIHGVEYVKYYYVTIHSQEFNLVVVWL